MPFLLFRAGRIILIIMALAGAATASSALWYSEFTGAETNGSLYLYNGDLCLHREINARVGFYSFDTGLFIISKTCRAYGSGGIQACDYRITVRGVSMFILGAFGLIVLWVIRKRRDQAGKQWTFGMPVVMDKRK